MPLQRAIKRGNVRTFDEEYNKGYTDIWASEVDADLDPLYAAIGALGLPATIVSPTPPTSAVPGELWWRNTDGNLFIYYDDGNSQQFVPVVSTGQYLGSGLPTGPAGGALAGQYPNPSLAPGAVTSASLGAGSVTDVKIASVSWSKITGVPAGFPPVGLAGGALLGGYPNPGVDYTKIQGIPLALPPNGPAGGALTGTYPNPGVSYASITGTPTIPTTLPPSGPAGGQLAGTYPNPTIRTGNTIIFVQSTALSTPILLGLNTERFVLELDWISASGRWFCMAGLHGHISIGSIAPSNGLTAQLRLDGNSGVSDGTGTVVSAQSFQTLAVPTGLSYMPFGISLPTYGNSLSAATHRIKLSAWITGQDLGNTTVDSAYILIGEGA